MTDQKQTPAAEVVYRANIDQQIAAASPEQLELARRELKIQQEALAAHDQRNTAKSQEDFSRKAAKMTDWEIHQLCAEADAERAREGNR